MTGNWLKAGNGGAVQLAPVFSTVYTSGSWANEPMLMTHSVMAAIVDVDFIYIFLMVMAIAGK